MSTVWLVSSSFTWWKYCSWSGPYNHVRFLLSRPLRGCVSSAKFGKNLPCWFTIPKNLIISGTLEGAFISLMTAVLSGSAPTPCLSTMWPRNLGHGWSKEHKVECNPWFLQLTAPAQHSARHLCASSVIAVTSAPVSSFNNRSLSPTCTLAVQTFCVSATVPRYGLHWECLTPRMRLSHSCWNTLLEIKCAWQQHKDGVNNTT